MSIIIPGMKMPKDGECVVVFADGVVQKYKAGGIAFFEYQDRLEETVAVQLPPHGRLIDADALLRTLQELFDRKSMDALYTGNRGAIVTWNDAIYHIKSAPSIIPADPEKEDT